MTKVDIPAVERAELGQWAREALVWWQKWGRHGLSQEEAEHVAWLEGWVAGNEAGSEARVG